MAGGKDDPAEPEKKQPQQSPADKFSPHVGTPGGPTGGGMVEQQQWIMKQLQAKDAQRRSAAAAQQKAKPETAQPDKAAEQAPEPQQQAEPKNEPKKLRTFEERHAQAPDRASLKREAGELKGQGGSQSNLLPPSGPQRPSGQGGRPPGQYKELNRFEDRHPPQPGHEQGRGR